MKEITSGFHYIISLRLLIKYITCFSAIPVILHKCVIWLPFIMCNCSVLQQCYREYLLWVEYLVKISGKIPKASTYPWQLWVSSFFFSSLLSLASLEKTTALRTQGRSYISPFLSTPHFGESVLSVFGSNFNFYCSLSRNCFRICL